MQGLAADTKTWAFLPYSCGSPLICHFYGDYNYTKLARNVQ
jgi:hypothetical protein